MSFSFRNSFSEVSKRESIPSIGEDPRSLLLIQRKIERQALENFVASAKNIGNALNADRMPKWSIEKEDDETPKINAIYGTADKFDQENELQKKAASGLYFLRKGRFKEKAKHHDLKLPKLVPPSPSFSKKSESTAFETAREDPYSLLHIADYRQNEDIEQYLTIKDQNKEGSNSKIRLSVQTKDPLTMFRVYHELKEIPRKQENFNRLKENVFAKQQHKHQEERNNYGLLTSLKPINQMSSEDKAILNQSRNLRMGIRIAQKIMTQKPVDAPGTPRGVFSTRKASRFALN